MNLGTLKRNKILKNEKNKNNASTHTHTKAELWVTTSKRAISSPPGVLSKCQNITVLPSGQPKVNDLNLMSCLTDTQYVLWLGKKERSA